MQVAIAVGVVWAGMTGCTADPQQVGGNASAGANHLPVVHTINVVPDFIVSQGVVTAVVETKDLDHDEVQVRYQWILNDRLLPGASSAEFDASRLKRGDRLSLEAIPFDGKSEGSPVRITRIVGNAPPVVQSVRLEPLGARAGDHIRAVVDGGDADGDAVRYSYRWVKNNQVVIEGENDSLETTGFSRADAIAVFVTPRDGTTPGKEMPSASLVLENHAPKFISNTPAALSQGLFSHAVTAIDPENDPVTYSLEIGPQGMTIDGKTGHIRWVIPPALSGTHHVKVVAKDTHDGWASQEFDVVLHPPATS
ncbi:MAG: Ig domain-containing protein [Nitrospira sp.]